LPQEEKLQEMMVHETAQSCYLINRFSQLLKLSDENVKKSLLLFILSLSFVLFFIERRMRKIAQPRNEKRLETLMLHSDFNRTLSK
jgi:hypothetical protein